MEVMVIYVWQCMVVLLYDCICARCLWSIMNEHAPATINMKGCTLMRDCRGTRAKEEKEEKKERDKRKGGKRRKKKMSTEGLEPVIFSAYKAGQLCWMRVLKVTRAKSRVVTNGNMAAIYKGRGRKFNRRSSANTHIRLQFHIVKLFKSAKGISTLTHGTARSSSEHRGFRGDDDRQDVLVEKASGEEERGVGFPG